MLSDKQLLRWYREYNRKWFSAALPEDIDILFAPVDDCTVAKLNDCDVQNYVLQINPRYLVDTCMVRMTLLHEMAHIKLWPYKAHGVRFQQEMLRLAKAGAFKGLW